MPGRSRLLMSAITGRRARRWVGPLVVVTTAALVFTMSELPTTSRAKADQAAVAQETSAARVTARPSADSAFAAARAQNARVEILDERTDASTTWALADGQRETEFSAPFRIQRGGRWYTLDHRLTATHGDVSLPVVSYGEKAAAKAAKTAKEKRRTHTAASPASSKANKADPKTDKSAKPTRLKSNRFLASGPLAPNRAASPALRKQMRQEMTARKHSGSRFGPAPVFAARAGSLPVRLSAAVPGQVRNRSGRSPPPRAPRSRRTGRPACRLPRCRGRR